MAEPRKLGVHVGQREHRRQPNPCFLHAGEDSTWLAGCLPHLLSSPLLPAMGWPLRLPARCLWASSGLWVGIPRGSGLGSGSSSQEEQVSTHQQSFGHRGALGLLIHRWRVSIKTIKGDEQPTNNIYSKTSKWRGAGEYWSDMHLSTWGKFYGIMCFLYQ